MKSWKGLLIASAGLALCAPATAHATIVITIRCVNSSDAACQASYATIGAAVTAANPGDIVLVGAGTYNETVIVNKKLHFLGARAGVDARTRTGTSGESIVNATGTGASNAGFIVTANDVVIDGFTVQGATDGLANGSGIDLKGGAASASGAQVLDNIIQNNAEGLSLNYEGFAPVSAVVVERNAFKNNAQSGIGIGDGIFTSGCQDVNVANNSFSGHISSALGINNCLGVSITENTSTGDATFVIFTGTTNAQFRDNQGGQFIAQPSSTGNGGAAVAVGPGNSDLDIADNSLAGGLTMGIRFTTIFGPGASQRVKVKNNRVAQMAQAGIAVEASTLVSSIIEGNTSTRNGGDGIFIDTGNGLNVVFSNTARRLNGGIDCHDNSTGSGTQGTANIWLHDHGATSAPAGICN